MQQELQIAIQHHQAGRLAEAIVAYRKALELEPNNPDIAYTLGVVLHTVGDFNSAIPCYRKAIQLRPNFPEALGNLGSAMEKLGQFAQAVAVLEQAVQLRPDIPELHLNFGNALSAAGQLPQAINAFRIATQLRPNWAAAHNTLGNALQCNGEYDAAIEEFRRAVALSPDSADFHYNLGNALGTIGLSDASLAEYRAAQHLRPDWAINNSNLLFGIHFSPESTAQSILDEHKKWNDRFAKSLASSQPNYANDRSPDRKLRIGYVAPDFYQHCQSLFTIPLFSNHNHEQFEIFCYADVPHPDAITARIKSLTDGWRSTAGMSDQQIAGLIKSDRIDILVDLTMHMKNGRPFVFARKPAPVQVAWLAYPSTTGLNAIDYRLTDPYLDPPGLNDAFYSEQSIRLPNTFWCIDPQAEVLVNALPADSTKRITFGCLNNFLKVNPGVLKLWSLVLREIPNSQMLIMAPKCSADQRVIDSLGVEPRRVQFVGYQPRDAYLRTYHRIDIGLDTFPYNGHTISLDAYWMGVPVVTMCGQMAVSRAGFSHYSNLGLTELVAHEPKDFTRIAVQLANDLPRLKELRSTLRERMKASPLMDGKKFARDVEDSYRAIWQKWCSTTR